MDSVPTWVLLVCLGALGALVMFFLGILRDHIKGDSEVHSDVKVTAAKVADIENKDLPKIIDKLADHDERLHNHGREIQSLIGKNYIRDRDK